ncbi:putative alpha/beta-hydrolase family hydrolase [Geodermatophilus bullaregiensis]|uniref:alpha/beta hydrolase family protein n=1 Tax=Geodermatophilus bullaregiensis TaxID=1564160 RepID=UPI00195CF325|nr:alpha/beta family hydrolase [Geodermatophilus bullaregiensis]MBM7806415.1 putative alpha/beta-hydrolase family hydrolase [Geodermatophilus bullaregiensis]
MRGPTLVDTPLGPAAVHADGPADGARGTLVLGHGAGGGVASADLTAVTASASAAGWRVLRVEQPWRVAGKRIAPAPPRLDTAWSAVLDALRPGLSRPLVLGGRSAGARVACRTASAQGADGVLALAFPLHPPGRPEKSRAAELTGAGVPLVVVQGQTDGHGRPGEVAAALAGTATASVSAVPGDHSLLRAPELVAAAALSWLAAEPWRGRSSGRRRS